MPSQRGLLSGTAQHGLGDLRALSLGSTREAPSLTIDLGDFTKYSKAPATTSGLQTQPHHGRSVKDSFAKQPKPTCEDLGQGNSLL